MAHHDSLGMGMLLVSFMAATFLAGCNSADKILPVTYSLPSDYVQSIQISNVSAENGGGKVVLKFQLINDTHRQMNINYVWTLNDPKADYGHGSKNINIPGARQYEGCVNIDLAPSSTEAIEITFRETREYDPEYYVKYIYLYEGDKLIGYYRGQHSPNQRM